MKDEAFEISKTTSDRVCKHMNEDHGVTIYAIMRSVLGWKSKIQGCKLKSITPSHCVISYVECNGDVCSMMEKQVPLNPPIQSPSQIRPRLVELHHKVMAPDLWHCIFAQPFDKNISSPFMRN